MDGLDIGSGNPVFACGHANPSGNRYCNVCGAERGRTCSHCRASNRNDASFCGGCGARLAGEGTAPEARSPARHRTETPDRPATHPTTVRSANVPTDPPGSEDEPVDRQALRSGGGSHLADLLASGIDDDSREDEWAIQDRRRRRVRVAAVVIATVACAIVLAVGQFGLAWHGGFLERLTDRLVVGRSVPQVTHSGRLTEATRVTPPAALPEQEPASAAPSPSATTQALASPDTRESLGATLPPTSRSRNEQLAERPEGASGGGAAQTLVLPPQTSEERMATFLLEELGPVRATEKALANAAWYDAGLSEHAYWQGVAEVIKRRAGL